MLLALDHLKTVLKALLLPPAGPLLLAIIGALWSRRRPRLGACLLALGLLGLWLLSLPVVAARLTAATQHYGALDLNRPTAAQAVVVLGGGGQRLFAPEYGGPAARPYLLERLAYGAYVARRTGLPVLVTGYRVEATAMRATLERNFNLTPRWIDAQAYDTYDNARDTARLLRSAHLQRILLVTSSTHMWRATHEFAATGLVVIPAPVGVVTRNGAPLTGELALLDLLPDAQALERSYAAVYELLGESVRVLLAATHLRRQSSQALTS